MSKDMVSEQLSLGSTIWLSTGNSASSSQSQPEGLPTGVIRRNNLQTPLGFEMPRIALGVYQNYTTHESVLEAFRTGYR